MPVPSLDLAAWQALAQTDPEKAAHEFFRRVKASSPVQQHAIWAWLPSGETELAARFADAGAGPLRGAPYALKDLFALAGVPTRAGSLFAAEVQTSPQSNGSLVQRLAAAGAVCAGKTHLHEFAYGLTGENPHYGDCEHPHFPGRTSGGSSSGSAAAVAAGIVPFAIGTDTGGSIRVPAAFCGLFGLRLTPHHPWIADAFPLAPSFDTAGWFTASATDMLAVSEALFGLGRAERKPHGGYIDFAALGQNADPEVAAAFTRTAEVIAPSAERSVREALLSLQKGLIEAYAVLQSEEALAVHSAWLDRFRDRYDPAVVQRLERARHWSDDQRRDARVKAAAVRLFWSAYFQTYDYLILPITPFPALAKIDCTLDHRNRLLALNALASLGGLPVLTVPVSLASGLSTGLQVIFNHPQSPVLPWVLTGTL